MPRKTTPPPLTEPHDLLSYSSEHIAYELQMFFGAVTSRDHVERYSPDSPYSTTRSYFLSSILPKSHFARNARIEVFILHLRNLIAFLYPDIYPPRRDDVAAHHFLPDPCDLGKWVGTRLPLSPTLEAAKSRADKELAHLTTKRIAGSERTKEWRMVPLAEEIRVLLLAFVSAADSTKLAASVSEAVPTSPLSARG